MNQAKSINVQNLDSLSRLAGMLRCSLARYLSYARPWSRRRYTLLMAILRKLGAEHQQSADEISRLLESRRERVASSAFPQEYTYYNDVSAEYLAPKLLRQQRFLIGATKAAYGALAGDREARRVLAKVLHGLRKYADLLDELLSNRRENSGIADKVRPASSPDGTLVRIGDVSSEAVEPQKAA